MYFGQKHNTLGAIPLWKQYTWSASQSWTPPQKRVSQSPRGMCTQTPADAFRNNHHTRNSYTGDINKNSNIALASWKIWTCGWLTFLNPICTPYIHVYMRVHVPVYMYVCVCTHVHIYTCTCVYVYRCTCVHVPHTCWVYLFLWVKHANWSWIHSNLNSKYLMLHRFMPHLIIIYLCYLCIIIYNNI